MLREAERCELGLFSNGRSAVLSVPVGVINFGRVRVANQTPGRYAEPCCARPPPRARSRECSYRADAIPGSPMPPPIPPSGPLHSEEAKPKRWVRFPSATRVRITAALKVSTSARPWNGGFYEPAPALPLERGRQFQHREPDPHPGDGAYACRRRHAVRKGAWPSRQRATPTTRSGPSRRSAITTPSPTSTRSRAETRQIRMRAGGIPNPRSIRRRCVLPP